MERRKNPNIMNVVRRSIPLSDMSHLGSNGFAVETLDHLSRQVSEMIDIYVSQNEGEMLRKTPDEIEQQFQSGNSTIIVTTNIGESVPRALCHVTMYETLTERQTEVLGRQVVEIGTVIVHPGFRGCGLGALAANRVILAAEERYGKDVLCLATNKQMVATWSLNSGGAMVPVSFWDFPYLSHLTCICTSCSENYGYNSCKYRRSSENSSPRHFEALLRRGIPGKMDCTLVVDNPEAAEKFESRCRLVHSQLGYESLLLGSQSITIESMQKAEEFFRQLG